VPAHLAAAPRGPARVRVALAREGGRARDAGPEDSPMRTDARWWLLGCFLVISWLTHPPRLEAG